MPRVFRDPRKRRQGLASSRPVPLLLLAGEERLGRHKVQPSSSDLRVYFIRRRAGRALFLVVLVSRSLHQGISFSVAISIGVPSFVV